VTKEYENFLLFLFIKNNENPRFYLNKKTLLKKVCQTIIALY